MQLEADSEKIRKHLVVDGRRDLLLPFKPDPHPDELGTFERDHQSGPVLPTDAGHTSDGVLGPGEEDEDIAGSDSSSSSADGDAPAGSQEAKPSPSQEKGLDSDEQPEEEQPEQEPEISPSD